ncbi:MAG: hypothetical protein WCW40_12245, partial [Bacteroidota bacterium]
FSMSGWEYNEIETRTYRRMSRIRMDENSDSRAQNQPEKYFPVRKAVDRSCTSQRPGGSLLRLHA